MGVDGGAEKHRRVLQKALQACGTTLQKTWRQMTPFEQAKVEQEYFKLLKEDSRWSLLQQSP